VLNFISLSENLSSARENIHNNLNKLNWVEGFYRKDIAFKVIGK
jgi:phosphoribosylamine-glycine ligase